MNSSVSNKNGGSKQTREKAKRKRTSVKLESPKRKKDNNGHEITQARIYEAEEEGIDMEVDGLRTEFLSEEEGEEGELPGKNNFEGLKRSNHNQSLNIMDCDDDREIIEFSANNNASILTLEPSMGERCDSREETVVKVEAQSTERQNKSSSKSNLDEEEAFFDRFLQYMEKRGKIWTVGKDIDASASAKTSKMGSNEMRKSDSNSRHRGNYGNFAHIDATVNLGSSNSETTMYRAAVHQAKEASRINKEFLDNLHQERMQKKCSSSSEDEPMNTSDESERTGNEFNSIVIADSGEKSRGKEKGHPRKDRNVEDGQVAHCS